MDKVHSQDVQVVLRELELRDAPVGEQVARVSLMLCGPVVGWLSANTAEPSSHSLAQAHNHAQALPTGMGALALGQEHRVPRAGFLEDVVGGLGDVEELFLDRPLQKSIHKHIISEANFVSAKLFSSSSARARARRLSKETLNRVDIGRAERERGKGPGASAQANEWERDESGQDDWPCPTLSLSISRWATS